MARSIVLRFPATCYDCGASIPAGATARWFGKGRVSCCGKGSPDPTSMPHPSVLAPGTTFGPVKIPPIDSAAAGRATDDSARAAAAPLAAPIIDRVSDALLTGLQPHHLAILAERQPEQRLCVRLTSGARFVVTARDAQHVLACIVESCRDSIRDVMGAAS